MHQFKVGDKVRVIGQCHDGCRETGCIFFNKIGTITKITNNGISVKYFENMTEWCSGFKIENLALTEEVIRQIKTFGIAEFCAKNYK